MARLKPFVPKNLAHPHVNDRPVPSGSFFRIRNRLGWRDAAGGAIPSKMLSIRQKRFCDKGIFAQM